MEGPDDGLDGNRLAVVPPGVAVQGEFDPGTILRHRDRLRQQAVFGEGLVGGVDHERIVKQVEAGRRPPLDDELVEAVVSALGGEPRRAALRRIRVDVTEMPDVGRIFRSEERRVGKECVRKCRYRWSTYSSKKTTYTIIS